jgi:bifunctional DNA-binding transcriptional regulator/antitoxin component of YhaV-PrlF toxin-antitoxin module
MAHEKYTFFRGKIFTMGKSHMVLVPSSVREYIGIVRGDMIEAIITNKTHSKPIQKKMTGVSNSSDGFIISLEEMKDFKLYAGDYVDVKIMKVKSSIAVVER